MGPRCFGQCLSDVNMPKCAILKVHLKVILVRKKKLRSKLRLSKVAMRLDESLNQSLQGDLKKISYMSSNEALENCCKVPNKHVIGHVLVGQNGGSTTTMTFSSAL